MGGSSSSVAKEYLDILHKYSTENHYKDSDFLSKLLSAAPNRAEAPPVDPQVLNEIATSQPENIKALLKECVKFIEVIQDGDNRDSIPNTVHNQISLVLQLFTTTMTVLARNPAHRELLLQTLANPNQKLVDVDAKPKKSKKSDSDSDSDSEDEKPKKSKKGKKDESDDEDEKPKSKKSKKSKKDEDDDEEEKPKKSKKSKKGDDSEDEEEKPKKKAKKSKKDESEDDSEDEDEKPKKSKKSKKDDDEDEEEKPKSKKSKKSKKDEDDEEVEEKPKKSKKSKKDDDEDEEEKPKKSKKSKKDDDEDEEEKPKKSKKSKKGDDEDEEEKPKKSKKSKKGDDEDEEEKPKKSKKGDDEDEEEKPKKSKKSKKGDDEDEEEKPKKSKKSKKGDDEDEEEKPKKSKKSKKDESDDEDEKPKKSKKDEDEEEKPKKSKKSKKDDDSEDEEEKPKKKAKKSKKDDSEDEDEEEKPKKSKKGKKLIIEDSDDDEKTNKARRSELSLLSRFMSAIFKCLFKKNVTLTTEEGTWQPASVDCESVALTRYDLVHSIIALTNIQAIAQPVKQLPRYTISVPPFNSDLFLLSLCQIASDFVVEFNTGTITLYSAEMVKNCLALVSDFVTKDPLFYKGFANVPADKAIAAFTGTPVQKELIFDPTSAFSSASLSFLYMMALYNKKFIKELGKSGLSNRFVFDLIYTMQFSFERVGVCYVHSILISTLMLILFDKNSAKELMKPQTQRLLVNFKPHSQTYADLLIEIILNLSGNESLLPSIVCLYHLISVNVDEISMNATFKLLVLFEKIAKKCLDKKEEKDVRLTEIFMEAFVRNITHGVNLRVLLIQKAAIFRKLEEDDDLEFNDSLAAIIAFLDKAKKLMSKANKKTMQTQEAIDFFKGLKVEDLFDDLDVDFEDHPHAFVGEMKKTWNEWSDMLALKSYESETNLLRQAIKI